MSSSSFYVHTHFPNDAGGPRLCRVWQEDQTVWQVVAPMAQTLGVDLAACNVFLYYAGIAIDWEDVAQAVQFEELQIVPKTDADPPGIEGVHLLTGSQAQTLLSLRAKGEDGWFLIRPSESTASYVLSITLNGSVEQFRIQQSVLPTGLCSFKITDKHFPRLPELVSYYHQKNVPLVHCSSNEELHLRHPLTEDDINQVLSAIVSKRKGAHRAKASQDNHYRKSRVYRKEEQSEHREKPHNQSSSPPPSSSSSSSSQSASSSHGRIIYEWCALSTDAVDEATGQHYQAVYYYNRISKQSVWDKPAAYPGDALVKLGNKFIRVSPDKLAELLKERRMSLSRTPMPSDAVADASVATPCPTTTSALETGNGPATDSATVVTGTLAINADEGKGVTGNIQQSSNATKDIQQQEQHNAADRQHVLPFFTASEVELSPTKPKQQHRREGSKHQGEEAGHTDLEEGLDSVDGQGSDEVGTGDSAERENDGFRARAATTTLVKASSLLDTVLSLPAVAEEDGEESTGPHFNGAPDAACKDTDQNDGTSLRRSDEDVSSVLPPPPPPLPDTLVLAGSTSTDSNPDGEQRVINLDTTPSESLYAMIKVASKKLRTTASSVDHPQQRPRKASITGSLLQAITSRRNVLSMILESREGDGYESDDDNEADGGSFGSDSDFDPEDY